MIINEILPYGNHVGTFDVVNHSGDVVAMDLNSKMDFQHSYPLGATAANGMLEIGEISGEAPASTSPEELATRTNKVDPNTRAQQRAAELLAMHNTRPDLENELPSDDNRGMYGR